MSALGGEQPFFCILRSWPPGAELLENGQVLSPTLPIVLSASKEGLGNIVWVIQLCEMSRNKDSR